MSELTEEMRWIKGTLPQMVKDPLGQLLGAWEMQLHVTSWFSPAATQKVLPLLLHHHKLLMPIATWETAPVTSGIVCSVILSSL